MEQSLKVLSFDYLFDEGIAVEESDKLLKVHRESNEEQRSS